jgi:hypothetical protein
MVLKDIFFFELQPNLLWVLHIDFFSALWETMSFLPTSKLNHCDGSGNYTLTSTASTTEPKILKTTHYTRHCRQDNSIWSYWSPATPIYYGIQVILTHQDEKNHNAIDNEVAQKLLFYTIPKSHFKEMPFTQNDTEWVRRWT